ncbi:GD11603 [Drosophila simulans]|uniref:GD11603 n=1 Tax=Drosophila simulans TaxID=7240 RepID=B4QGG9_DROSI|nr:GD11603 [Drosophila simulans]
MDGYETKPSKESEPSQAEPRSTEHGRNWGPKDPRKVESLFINTQRYGKRRRSRSRGVAMRPPNRQQEQQQQQQQQQQRSRNIASNHNGKDTPPNPFHSVPDPNRTEPFSDSYNDSDKARGWGWMARWLAGWMDAAGGNFCDW